MKPTISFIFPVHNEAPYLESQLQAFTDQLPATIGENSYEILLIENGNEDNSWDLMEEMAEDDPRIVPLRITSASYGRAVKHGLLAAHGSYSVVLNIDFFPASFVSQALLSLKEPETVAVVGSKLLQKGNDERGLLRHTMSLVSHNLIKLITGYQGTDTHGVKAFKNTPELKKLIYRCNAVHELFDTELVVALSKLGDVIELPVRIREYRPTRYFRFERWFKTAFDINRVTICPLLQKLSRPFTYQHITADDYGRLRTGTQAILDLAEVRSVTTVSILANSVSRKNIIDLRKRPAMRGLHFNLTFGAPIIKSTTLADANNDFFILPVLIVKLVFRQIQLNDIEKELIAQLARLEDMKAAIEYIDSEQHIHLLAPIRAVVQKVAKRKGLQIRDRASTIAHLQRKPMRLVIFLISEKLLSLVYREATIPTKSFTSVITHPGLDYD